MFNRDTKQARIDTLIGKASRVHGDLEFAGGLHLGGCRPIILMQCTGFFEAGDAFRNFVHDLNLPLFFVIGVRGYYAHQQGATADTCPVFTEPIVQAWRVPYIVLDKRHTAADVAAAYRQALADQRAGIALLAE